MLIIIKREYKGRYYRIADKDNKFFFHTDNEISDREREWASEAHTYFLPYCKKIQNIVLSRQNKVTPLEGNWGENKSRFYVTRGLEIKTGIYKTTIWRIITQTEEARSDTDNTLEDYRILRQITW